MACYCYRLISSYWGGSNYGGYTWKLSASKLIVRVNMKDMKYSLIKPFWVEIIVEDFIWKWEIDFGMIFSNQIVSSSVDADF